MHMNVGACTHTCASHAPAPKQLNYSLPSRTLASMQARLTRLVHSVRIGYVGQQACDRSPQERPRGPVVDAAKGRNRAT